MNPTAPDHVPYGKMRLQFGPSLNGWIGDFRILQVITALKIEEELWRCIKRISKQTRHIRSDTSLTRQKRIKLLLCLTKNEGEIALGPTTRL